MGDPQGHTPGPWSFDNDWHRLPTIFGPDGKKHIAIVEKEWPIEQRKANAAMLTAAPEMYLAGNELASAACDVHPIAPSSASIDRLHTAIDAWTAAQLKAEGRENG